MDDARDLLATRLGARPLRRILGGGYTLMEHWLVELEGRRAFAKVAVDEPTAGFLRDEYRVYNRVRASFIPRLVGWNDDGERPVLLIEDLTAGHWPPPWRPGDIKLVREALVELHATTPPGALEPLTWDDLNTWRQVEADPRPFLSLRLCSAGWLERALPELLAATEQFPLAGGTFLHLDVRSDNICVRNGRALLVDWNWASIGNATLDVAFWLPSLYVEGGPQPSEVLPDAAEVTAVVSGFFAAVAGLPPPAGAPTVRPLQLAQLKVALPWAVDVLGLPPLDA